MSDHEATAATVDALIEAVAGVADFAEVLVEPFVSAEPPAVNGHVHLPEAAAIDIPVRTEPAPPQSPVIEHALVVVDASEPAVVATAIAITEPEPITRLALPEPAPDPLVIELPDAEPAEMTTGAPLELVATPCIDEPDPVASALAAPEPETTAPAPSTPIVEPHVPPALELEVLSIEPNSTPLAAVPSELVTVPAAALAPTPALETDPVAAAMTELEPVATVAPALALEPDPVAAAIAEEALAAAPADAEPPAPVVIVTPSVFSRRAPAQTAPNGDQRVAFAGVSKELLPHATRTSQMEPPASIQRPSVEEITRATLNDLVGAASEKTAAFASPARAFLKRPRTIAPPPSDGQPIGAGPKLARAARREESSSPAVASAAAGDTAAAPVVPPQQGFEGVQFPNDGVLTRQWMEFLNQMAGDK